MAKARAIVKRRKSVQNIRKITRTMELIATARFKKALDRATEAEAYTRKIAELVADLGATYHCDGLEAAVGVMGEPDIIIEATGAATLVVGAMTHTSSSGVVCLTGVSSPGRRIDLDVGSVNRDIVLENDVVFGSVNASVEHYVQAAAALASADHDWLARLVSRRAPLANFGDAFEVRGDDVKVVLP